EIVIYTFIYEGVPNWQKTDGIVKIYVPYEPIIETYLTEGNDLMNMCAIARIINNNNNISVERINRYFRGHEEMDLAFGWGFRWQSARK
ncbi:MAG: hypothetical protein IJU40_05935, partial [Desulfovibrionaceae bacterium]|nr:hypothetical protein [Desulfovibrionaceae bacterium]